MASTEGWRLVRPERSGICSICGKSIPRDEHAAWRNGVTAHLTCVPPSVARTLRQRVESVSRRLAPTAGKCEKCGGTYEPGAPVIGRLDRWSHKGCASASEAERSTPTSGSGQDLWDVQRPWSGGSWESKR